MASKWASRVGCLVLLVGQIAAVAAQLPDDLQRELNQNLAEQARIQAQRQQHQSQIRNRISGGGGAAKPAHDPNNYSYQQVSPPIQYSYYQPFGDSAAGSQPRDASARSDSAPNAANNNNFDLNSFGFDMPQAQARVAAEPPARPSNTASFTGAGGLPVLPVASALSAAAPGSSGAAGPQPQPQVQQGPPLTEADFRDITGAENYGAGPGSNDFGGPQPRQDPSAMGDMAEFGLGAPGGPQQRQAGRPEAGDFSDFGGMNLAGGAQRTPGSGREFAGFGDDAPESRQGGAGAGPPGSLEGLLGMGFPGLASGGPSRAGAGPQRLGGLEAFASGAGEPQSSAQRPADDGSSDIADLGERSDEFSGADLSGLGQPSPRQDPDFTYAAAASEQPSVVPYPDAAPQPVGTLWAVTQPQSLTQARYSALPDKGTYQDYPAYLAELDGGAGGRPEVSAVVDETPAARPAGPGRYGWPAAGALAPENRPMPGRQFDYARDPYNQ